MVPRKALPCVLLAALALLGFQSTFLFFVVNATDDPIDVGLRIAVPGSSGCPSALTLNYLARSELHRLFGDPELRPATGVRYDPAQCRVEGKVPEDTALRIESVGPVPGSFYHDAPGAELVVSGAAGGVRLTGQQILRYLESTHSPEFEYGSKAR